MNMEMTKPVLGLWKQRVLSTLESEFMLLHMQLTTDIIFVFSIRMKNLPLGFGTHKYSNAHAYVLCFD
jgi:hypothetical protein